MEKKDLCELYRFAKYWTEVEYGVADEMYKIYQTIGDGTWRAVIKDWDMWLEQFWKKCDKEGMMIDIEKEDFCCLYEIVLNYFGLLYLPEWIKVGKRNRKEYLEVKKWLEILKGKYEVKEGNNGRIKVGLNEFK